MTQLIADSGSTKTDWQLIADGKAVSINQTDGFNPYYQTTDQIIAVLQTQLLPQLSGVTVTEVFFYGAGCSGPAVNPIVADALQLVLTGAPKIEVNSDMLGAARAASGREPGIVCILGTGSNACCYNGQAITRGIESLGFWLGDEGSGGYLGKTLIQDFFQKRLPADLHDAFRNRYALDRPTLLENAYRKPYPNRYFASFTPFLSENLAHPYVVQSVTDAFVRFMRTYVNPFPETEGLPVHAVGSIAHHFAESLGHAIRQCGLRPGGVLKTPIDRLVQFHRKL